MNVGDKVTITKTTFEFGHSKSAVILPAVLNIPKGAELKMTIEVISFPGSETEIA